MPLKKPDLREYERQEGDKIPDALREFTIDSGLGDRQTASVADFSPKGIRLRISGNAVPASAHEVVLLSPAGEPMILAGEVIHVFPDGAGNYYLGILFLPTRSLLKYRQMIA